MTTSRKTLGICDICGFRFKLRDLKKNSYGLMVCSTDYERYDLKNHPQNRVPNVKDNPAIRNPRPDDGGRGTLWNIQNSWITVDPTTLEETRHTTKYDDANRAWDLIWQI